jgi:hypothetical protein
MGGNASGPAPMQLGSMNRTFDQFKIPLEKRNEVMSKRLCFKCMEPGHQARKSPKRRVTAVSACGGVVPGKKINCEEVCGEAEKPVDPVSGEEVFQSDLPCVQESTEFGLSSSEHVLGWVNHASHE